ncbi:hypothetical protein [Bythopirellula polymerisocia]|uniref:Uncharacterized protein n=1 Tax=Bythopirellula polymerisocia TaxID=2528003 RepID=A0A5C6CIQ8_9BACT|nr:hypothetical protein [Bythopirellula polymerisocia]TWU24663.1 hypothetical protein Pla144_35490 [Bythopirellula polymerisocia]
MTYPRFLTMTSLGVALTLGQLAQAQILNSQPSGTHKSVGGAPQMHQDSEVRQSSWPSIPLPKITMPKVSMPNMSSLTNPVKSGFQKVSSGTKKAWEGTKEMFTFGGEEAPAAQNSSQEKQGFWSSIFSSEPEQPSGPQTVGEWMAQPRLEH